jgi:hypothetical protein
MTWYDTQSRWVCHIAGKVRGLIEYALVRSYLHRLKTSLDYDLHIGVMWLTNDQWTVLVSTCTFGVM